MKKTKKGLEPRSFFEFKEANPDADWKNSFRNNAGQGAIDEVKKTLLNEQYGLCIYCEVDLKNAGGNGYDDFRVEHFFPENPKIEDKRNDGINYALYWPNLFGCCSGGNEKYVIDSAERYSNPDFHCDVPKSNKEWTSLILDPTIDVPAFPSLFEFDEEGTIFASRICPDEFKTKVNNTIVFLNLNSSKLKRFRAAIISSVRGFISDQNFASSLEDLAKIYLLPNGSNNLSPFFTTIRWYLGPVGEDILTQAGYDG